MRLPGIFIWVGYLTTGAKRNLIGPATGADRALLCFRRSRRGSLLTEIRVSRIWRGREQLHFLALQGINIAFLVVEARLLMRELGGHRGSISAILPRAQGSY